MPINVVCPKCAQKFTVSDALSGKRARCGKCQNVIQIPVAEPELELVEAELTPLVDDPLGIGSMPLGMSSARQLSAPSPLASPARYEEPSSSALPSPRLVLIGCGAIAGLVLVSLVIVGISQLSKLSFSSGPVAGVATNALGGTLGPLDPTQIPIPAFPELGQPQTIDGGVQVYFVDTRNVQGNMPGTGLQMRMRVYVPPGQHEPHSLPCVLVAPAGTPLISGNDVDAGDYHKETLPYAQAGMVAINYSLDGPGPESQELARFVGPYKQFKATGGGVVNGRNALEFALQKLVVVDPKRIYCAGHSSAATVSLLVAAHEPRIRACLAYAPCTDVELRMKDLTSDWAARRAFPGIADFLRDTSPRNHLQRYKCPLFVFHARDDSNEPFATTEQFASSAQQAGVNITFAPVDRGDHYESMIDQGIPQGIAWIKSVK